jgi:3-oxoacyl-[acyl-carrier-protein] synthase-3
MRFDDIYIAGLGGRYPKGQPVEEAVLDGRYSAALHERTRQRRVAIATDEAAADMAVHAGRLALRRSGHHGDDVALLLHATAGHNGLDGWNAASYVQHRVLGQAGWSLEVRQLSNGALASIELARAYLHATGGEAAMITTADRFDGPAWNRWTASPGLVFGDGASATVLSRRGGFARIRSCVSVADPELEGMQRGTRPLGPGPADEQVSLHSRTLEFAETMPLREATRRMAAGLRAAADRAADEAELALDQADHYVLPNFGWELLHKECLEPLGLTADRTTWTWGNETGHCGASDQFGALDHLAERNRLQPGQRVLVVGVGGGFNWTCAVVDILDPPRWAGLPI